MSLEALIFDLDGVLCQTVSYHYQSWKETVEQYDISFTRQDNEQLRGLTRRRSLEVILDGRQVGEEQMQKMMDHKNRRYLELIAGMGPESRLPGAARLMEESKAAGLKIAVASGSRHVRTLLERLDLLSAVDVCVNGGMVSRSKPAPDTFLLAARRLDVAPASCLVIEDAPAGIQAALAAHMCAVGVGSAADLDGAHAHFASLEHVTLATLRQVFKKSRRTS